MVDLAYAYSNARVKAMRSKLFDRERIREVMDVRSLPEVIEMLEESPYKKHFVEASTKYSGVELVKSALDANLVSTFQKVWEISPAKAKPLLSLLLQQWEVNNLKKAIAAIGLGKSISLQHLVLVGGWRDAKLLEKIVSQDSLEGVAKALEFTEYWPSFKKAFAEYRKTRDFRLLLAALDEYYYSLLSKAAASPGVDEMTKRFLEHKIGFAAAIAVLRMKHSGVPAEKIRRHLLHNSERFRRLLEKMVSAESFEKAAEFLAAESLVGGAAIREKAGRRDLSGVEVELEKALLSIARKTLSRSVLSMGALVGYLFLKQEEVHALRKIAYATQFDVKQEIRETILAGW